MNIRRLVQQDLDGLLTLASHSLEAPQWPRQTYEAILQSTPADLLRCCWVAMRQEKLAAFAVTGWLRGENAAEVETLLVDLDYRRQGIGSALIGVCMSWAASAGAVAIRLEVRPSNAAAIALYRRRGFIPTGTRPEYYSAPVENALLLQAPLVPFTAETSTPL